MSHFDWDSKKITTLATVDEGKETRFNDAKCDASGRLWCGKNIRWLSCKDYEGRSLLCAVTIVSRLSGLAPNLEL